MKKNNILIFIICLLSICFFIKDFNYGKYDRLIGDGSILIVLLLPKIINKMSKLKINNNLYFIYIIFIFIAQFLGCVVNLYNITWWYDLFAHFVSGVITAILGLVILKWFKLYDKNKYFNIIFMILTALSIAVLWEYIEFSADIFFKMNVQHSIETGVKDTMEDLLIASCGTIITVIYYYIIPKKKLNRFLESLTY